MTDHRDFEMLLDYLHGQIPEAELAILYGRLEAEPELACQLQQLAQHEAALADWSQTRRVHVTADAADPPSPAASRWQRSWDAIYDVANNYITLSLLISAITIAIIVLSLGLIVPDQILPAPGGEVEIAVIANVTSTRSATWDESSHVNFKNVALLSGDRVVLNSGLAEITYNTGTRVVLEGPVELVVRGSNSSFLKLGKIVARCDSTQSKGFTVETPTALVKDLSTEFAVTVDQGGLTDVQVIDGAVQLNKQAGTSDTASLVLKAGQSARVDRAVAGIALISKSPADGRFVQIGDIKQRSADWYRRQVMALKPTAYWQMEGADDLQVTDTSPSGHHGELHLGADPHEPWVRGHVASGLRLRGAISGDGVVVSDYPKTDSGQLTVAAWVRAESYSGHAVVAANWGQKVLGQFHFGLDGAGGDVAVFVTQSDGEYVVASEGDLRPLPTGRWQHVAFVADGQMIRLFRNGREVASVEYDGTIIDSPLASMGIGCKLDDDGATKLSDYWHGSIDELVLFNRALTPAELRSIARVGFSP